MMSESVHYYEKCVCGATITLTENYEFTSNGSIGEKFERWQDKHQACLQLFHQIQAGRMKQLERTDLKSLKD
jgi:hypothetical protein